MAGTKAGGLKALATNKQRYGEDFYRSIGSKGGKAGHTGGFAFGDNGQKYGAIGGKLSRRGRIIRVGDPLKPTEVMILTTMAIGGGDPGARRQCFQDLAHILRLILLLHNLVKQG